MMMMMMILMIVIDDDDDGDDDDDDDDCDCDCDCDDGDDDVDVDDDDNYSYVCPQQARYAHQFSCLHECIEDLHLIGKLRVSILIHQKSGQNSVCSRQRKPAEGQQSRPPRSHVRNIRFYHPNIVTNHKVLQESAKMTFTTMILKDVAGIAKVLAVLLLSLC